MSESPTAEPLREPPEPWAATGQIDLRQLYFAALIMTFGSAAAFGGIFLLRGGLAGTLQQVFGIFTLAILPVWSSVFALTRVHDGRLKVAVALTSSIVFAILFPVLGFLAGYPAIWLAFAAIALMTVTGWRNIFSALRSAWVTAVLCTVLLVVLLIVFTSAPRLFLPETLVLGMALTDLYYHNAIAQMIAHHGAISTGADGLAYSHYHFLSHILAAGTARSAGADVPLIYLYWGAITLKVQLVWSTLAASTFFFRIDGPVGRAVLIRFCYACLATIFVDGLESESFMCGTALLLTALPLLLTLGGTEEASTPTTALALGLGFFVSMICAFAKISAGFFCAVALFVALWRFRRRPAIVASIAVFLSVLAFVALRWIVEKNLISFDHFYVAYSEYFNAPLTFKNYCLAIFVLVLLLTRWRTGSDCCAPVLSVTVAPDAQMPSAMVRPLKAGRARLKDGLSWFLGLDRIPQFLALSIAGCLFVLLTVPIGFNNAYFSWILYSVAFLFLPVAVLKAFPIRPRQATVALALVLLLSLNLFLAAVDFVLMNDSSLANTIINMYLATADSAAARQSGHPHVKDSLLASLRRTGRPFSELQSRIEEAPIARVQEVLQVQARMAGGRLAVHIPPQAGDVWHVLKPHSTWWCFASHLVVPAVTGIVEIRSIEPKSVENECTTIAYYGFGPAQEAHRSVPLSDDALCRLARPLKVEKIYRLQSYRDLAENRVVTCP